MEEIKLTETKISTEPQQIILKSKLSIGVRILSILFMLYGVTAILAALSQWTKGYISEGYIFKRIVLFHFVNGVGMLIGGIGMLRKKDLALGFIRLFLGIEGGLYGFFTIALIVALLGRTSLKYFLGLLSTIFFCFFRLHLFAFAFSR